jgi:hypothetical protein
VSAFAHNENTNSSAEREKGKHSQNLGQRKSKIQTKQQDKILNGHAWKTSGSPLGGFVEAQIRNEERDRENDHPTPPKAMGFQQKAIQTRAKPAI